MMDRLYHLTLWGFHKTRHHSPVSFIFHVEHMKTVLMTPVSSCFSECGPQLLHASTSTASELLWVIQDQFSQGALVMRRHQDVLETLLISNVKVNTNRKIRFNLHFSIYCQAFYFVLSKIFLFMFCTFVLKMVYFDVGIFVRIVVS